MRDRVIVPTFSRPEMLWACLDRLALCPEISDVDVFVYLDWHRSLASPPAHEVKHVLGQFPQLRPQLRIQEPHDYSGNSFNVLSAYRDAFNDGCELVFEVEDDVMVSRDFITWCRNALSGSEWFAAVAADNYHGPRVENAEHLASIGICYPRRSLQFIVEHVRHEYFADQRGYCRARFPQIMSDAKQVYFSEQDGLIKRVMLERGKSAVWSNPPRAFHVGWYGYHRQDGRRPQGGIVQRYQELKRILSDKNALAMVRGRYQDVDFPSGERMLSNG